MCTSTSMEYKSRTGLQTCIHRYRYGVLPVLSTGVRVYSCVLRRTVVHTSKGVLSAIVKSSTYLYSTSSRLYKYSSSTGVQVLVWWVGYVSVHSLPKKSAECTADCTGIRRSTGPIYLRVLVLVLVQCTGTYVNVSYTGRPIVRVQCTVLSTCDLRPSFISRCRMLVNDKTEIAQTSIFLSTNTL